MIQRIQSLWLLLSALIILSLSRLSIFTGTSGDGTVHTLMTAERLHLMILAIFLIILPLITIFLFKNRVAQKKIIWIHILLNLLMILFFYLAKDAFMDKLPMGFTSSRYGLGVAIPAISIVFDVLAYQGIRADEKLIKSADKFR
jgi:hypothetical protein